MTRQRRQIVLGRLSQEQLVELVCPMDALLRDADGRSNFESEEDREEAWNDHRDAVIRFYQNHEEYNRHGDSLPWPAERYDE